MTNDRVAELERELELLARYAGSQANALRAEVRRGVRCRSLALRLARMGEPTDPVGVVDRRTVTLTELVDAAIAALRDDDDEEAT